MLIDLTGKHFDRLFVVKRSKNAGRQPKWECLCSCGNTAIVHGSNLRHGYTKSCGCLHQEATKKANTTHGESKSKTYVIWRNMINRCENYARPDFINYGGRGISVCQKWRSFVGFVSDMGKAMPGMSIDRINTDGNYEPSNCRWATATQQARNKRNTRLVEFNGNRASLAEHCKSLGLNYRTIHQRLKRGWTANAALSTPIRNTTLLQPA
jgi:hypothetical protein